MSAAMERKKETHKCVGAFIRAGAFITTFMVAKHAFVLLVQNFGRCNFKSSDVLNIMMTVVLKHINIMKISETNEQMH